MATAALVLAACSDGSLSVQEREAPTDAPAPAARALSVSGVAAAGYAACRIDVATADGAALASGRSSGTGRYEVEIEGAVPGAVGVVRATGCSYEDEATGLTVRDAAMSAYFVVPAASEAVVHVTPMTEIAARRADYAAAARVGGLRGAQGTPSVLAEDILSARDHLSSALSGGMIDFVATEPVLAIDPRSASASEPSRDYGLLLAALSGAGEREAVLATFGPEEGDEDGRVAEEAIEMLVTGAGVFELTGRNLSGRPAPLAVASAAADGKREGVAPVFGAVPVLDGTVGAPFAMDLAPYLTDADGALSGLKMLAWALPEGLALSGTVITGTPTRAGASRALIVAYDGQGGGAVARLQFAVTSAPDAPQEDPREDPQEDPSDEHPEDEPANAAPTARIAAPVTTAVAPFTASFDARGSSDADGAIADYAWDFGDGTVGSGPMPSHTYRMPGAYRVRLIVSDDDGATGEAITTITAMEAPNAVPTARIAAPADVAAGRPVAFDASGSSDPDGTVVSYAWTFGDGGSATGPAPTHTYDVPGTYAVTLTVTDDDGASAQATDSVAVAAPPNAAPIARINGKDRRGEAPYTSFFDAGASSDADGEIVAYAWDFGDGTTSDRKTLHHTFEQPGIYAVTLTVTDDDGAVATQTRTATISRASALMPIEVMSAAGTKIERRTVALASADGVDRIRITCHRCAYRDAMTNPDRGAKAMVRLNDGAWVDITDEAATVEEPAASYGGIAGGYHTVTFTLPIEGARDGENEVWFRFNGTDGTTSGYRVLAFDLLKNSRPYLAPSQFRQDDPVAWTPPSTVPGDITAGGELWHRTGILETSPFDASVMEASCADCHAVGARDLKYFNYSNESIVARSEFHGLTREESEQIASYVRTRDVPAPDAARPWNPPYQPGPGLDERPVAEWAAGAGLEWVLDDDLDALPYAFPDGTTPDAIASAADFYGTINVREIPIALQFPDWNEWLPEVHPKDVWQGTYYEDGASWQGYLDLRARFERDGTEALIASGDVPQLFGSFERATGIWLNEGSTHTGGKWRVDDGATFEALKPEYSFEVAKSHLARLLATKNWEVAQEFGLEDEAPRIYADGKGEVRAWPANQRSVFNVAPHITADNKNNFRGQDPMLGDYHTTVWYQLQMTLNANQKQPAGEHPMDWPYQQKHIGELAVRTGVPNPVRFAVTQIKANQEKLNGRGSNRAGYELRVTHPWWNHSDPWQNVHPLAALDEARDGLRADVTTALLAEFLDVVENDPHPSFRPETWFRVAHDGQGTKRWFGVEPMDYVPVPYEGPYAPGNKLFEFPGNYHADNFFRVIPLFRETGVDEAVLERLRAWCASMWPAGDWDRLRAPDAPNVRREVPASRTTEAAAANTLITALHDRDPSTVWSAPDFPRTLTIQSAWGFTVYDGIEIEGADDAAYQYRVETGDGRVLADRTANREGGSVLRAEFDGSDADRRANRVKVTVIGCAGDGCRSGPRLEEVRLYGRDG